ncbi:signal peptidase I [Mesorhizobium sp. IMUNJ 23232]|uniref:signal peptidase I n=1 Tax=Mesorhizobium sp. IMUNJ 23232 TaxID=3376064 RepID=UPI0037905033
MSEARSRSWWSTALVSFATGPFGGFLWIGAGRWALASLVVMAGALLYFCYFGIPLLPENELTGALFDFARIALGVVSILVVVPFTRWFSRDKWYAHGLSVFLIAFVLPLAVAFAIRSFLFQPFSIPASSMEPTLQVGDHLWVSKSAYGYSRYSVPFGLLPIEGRVFGREPERGDIVVLKRPNNPQLDYVERLVGLPGETIQMIGGVLHINGVAVTLEDIGAYASEEAKGTLQRETLPNGVSYSIVSITDNSLSDDTQAFTVPAGHYFVLGDNRDNSADSRFSLGFVPYENLIGKAVRLYWNSNGVDYFDRQTLRQ